MIAASGAGHRLARLPKDGAEDRSQSEHVGACIDPGRVPCRLLWCHETGGADRSSVGSLESGSRDGPHLPGRFRLRGHRFGDAPVQYEGLTELADHDIVRFEIAVDHTARVRKGNGITDAQEESQQVTATDPPGVLVETDATHQPHDIVRTAVLHASAIVNGHDPGVFEPCQEPGLAGEALTAHRFVGVDREDLERHVSVKFQVVGPVDGAHPSPAQQGSDLVPRPRGRCLQRRAQPSHCRVGQSHGNSTPSMARASARNSASDPVSALSACRTCVLNRGRAHAR